MYIIYNILIIRIGISVCYIWYNKAKNQTIHFHVIFNLLIFKNMRLYVKKSEVL